MAPEFITIELARLVRFASPWERRWHHYELLLTAGISADEASRIVNEAYQAERIASLAAEGRAAELEAA